MDLNKVMLIGRLTKNPELRTTPNGQSVTTFSLATNRYFTDGAGAKQERSEFHTIVAWGKLAEICNQYLAKGRRAYIEGRMQTRDWVAQDGTRRYTTEVIAENMIILDSAQGGGGRSAEYGAAGAATGSSVAPDAAPDDDERTLETIPF